MKTMLDAMTGALILASIPVYIVIRGAAYTSWLWIPALALLNGGGFVLALLLFVVCGAFYSVFL